MKEFLDNLISFCKGIMQPLITVAMILVFVAFAVGGKFTGDQVFQVVVGVIVFWFGYTAFKFGTGGSSATEATANEKADLIQTVATQSQDLATSTPAPVVNTILEKLTPAVTTTVSTGSTVAAPAVNTDLNSDPELDKMLEASNG